jgi:iron complex outermembrane recepter protein
MKHIAKGDLARAVATAAASLSLLVLTTTLAMSQATPSSPIGDKSDMNQKVADAAAGPATARPADTSGLEEITVTARYTKENMQSTPVAITAINVDQLKAANVNNLTNLGALVPNLYTHPGDAEEGGSPTIVMRGVAENDASYAREPAVGIYIDDVYHSTVVGSAIDLNDIDHVEVKRGPQGTLEGNASIGGSINIYSQQPKGDDSGFLSVLYGSFNKVQLDGAFDTTILPNLYMRVSGSIEHQDGYVKLLDFTCEMDKLGTPQLAGSFPAQPGSSQRGCQTGTEGGTADSSVKVMLRYVPNDDLELNFKISYAANNDEDSPEVLVKVTNPYPNPNTSVQVYNTAITKLFGVQYDNRFLAPPGQPYSAYSTFCRPNFGGLVVQLPGFEPVPNGFCYPNAMDMSAFDSSFKIDYNITSDIHMKAIFAVSQYKDSVLQNGDVSPLGYTLTAIDQPVQQETAEVRFNGSLFDNRFKWVTGGFYLTSAAQSDGAVGFIADNFTETDEAFKHTASGFFHGDYKITDKWSFSGGSRFTWDELQYRLNHPPIITIPEPFTVSENRFDWLGATNYQFTDNIMGYVSVATGSRPPGITTVVNTAQQLSPYQAEELTSYEVGLKNEFFDHRLRINADVFYADYKKRLAQELGYQCLGQPGTATWTPTTSACAGYANPASVPWQVTTVTPAIVDGFEWEVTAKPIDALLINWSGGYNHFKSLVRNPADPGYNYPGNLAQPEWNMGAGIQYAIPVIVGTFIPRMDWSYQTRQTFNPNTVVAPMPAYTLPAQSVFNAQFTLKPNESKWTVQAGITNLFNKFYYYQLFNEASGLAVDSNVAPPREFTVRLRRDF